jgi:AraC-like DNA-binding protein
MHFAYHEPPGQLAAYVKTIWAARGTKEEFDTPEPIVPDGCIEVIFNLGDQFINRDSGELQPRALLAGQMTRPVTAAPTGNVDLLGVRFWTGRGGPALRVPVWQLQDQLIAASSVISGLDRLADDLRNIARDRRSGLIARELSNYLRPVDGSSLQAIDHALDLIVTSRGNLPIESIARRVGMSRRHLERRFRNEVGLRAKHLARIVRVHTALRFIDHPLRMSGAEIAAVCGYSDQAHLIREFKALTGTTPARITSNVRSLASLIRES